MSARRRRGGKESDAPQGPIQFRLEAHEESLTTDEGRELTGRGYVISDPRTGTPLSEDDFFFRIGGGIVCDLADGEAHLEAMQATAFRPGRTLALVRLATDHEDDPPVIEVRDSAGAVTVGRLPAEVAEAVAFYGSESYESAFCLWEWKTESGQRFALRLLLAPDWTTEQLPEDDPVTV
ncbi:MAG: hypothetical protein NVS3B21_08550 [Acidimicrobiales bacterium]